MPSFTRWFLVALGLSLTCPASAAGDPNEKAIEARQAAMTLQSWYAGPLFLMAKGDLEYDAEMARTWAANLKMVVNADVGAMWPEGSANDAYAGKTRALPELWARPSELGEKARALAEAVAALAEVAGDGRGALRSRIGDVGKACKGCHDDFRADAR